MMSRILVVDDEPDLESMVLQNFRHEIRQGEMDFLFACDGEDALSQLGSNADVDIVISDIQHAQNRQIQIRRLNAHFASRTGLGNTGPNNHGRNANAAFVDATFATAQRVVAGDGGDVLFA